MSKILHMLAEETGLSLADLGSIVRTAPRRYKVYTIPKRSGGLREIAQPARELKFIQRVLVAKVLDGLPVHSAATAYRKGLSIRDNSAAHSGSTPILKMDFEDFFPSIRSKDWHAYCEKLKLFDESDIEISARLLFRRAKEERVLRLSVGAPSSPALSNALLLPFDELVSVEAERRGISYTRYADDLTFAGQRAGMLKDMVIVVNKAVRSIPSPKLRINTAKTTFITTSRRRVVTGIVLANDGQVGVGRDKRRLISAKVHRASLGQLSAPELRKLNGDLAFVNVAEPAFLERLRRKYGTAVIDSIKRASGSRPT